MTDMSPERSRNLALLRRLYHGLESGGIEEITATFSPVIVLHLRGAGQLDGTFRGLAEVRSTYRRVLDVLGAGFKLPPYQVLVHDETLVVVPRGSRFGDAWRGLDVYHVQDGGFIEAWLTAWPIENAETRMTEDTPALTARMQRTMQHAGELARARGHDHLGTEHLILALIDDPNGIAGGAMHRLECADAIRDEVIRIIESDGYSGGSGSPPRSTPAG